MNRAIIVAAGRSVRFGGDPKLLVDLGGQPVLTHSLTAFERCRSIGSITLVVAPELIDVCWALVEELGHRKPVEVVVGADERQDSVRAGLDALPPDSELVAVHDGARPLVSTQEIEMVVAAAATADGAILATPVTDTIKQVADDIIERTIERSALWQAQTPQVFGYRALVDSYNRAMDDGFYGTDDAAVVERCGYRVKVVRGRPENLKITTRLDLVLAGMLLARQP